MRKLYPDIEPYRSWYLTRAGHRIHVEEAGNPEGMPVLFLHGGPGSGCKPCQRRFFDPARYRIILFDQRGAGQSTPQGRLDGNTTAELIGDMEALRLSLAIERWLLFGGSWGATLALLYAEAHARRVSGLVLRGTFLARASDLAWFASETGAPRLYPEVWEQLLRILPQATRHRPLTALHGLLNGPDELARRRAARAWEHWSSQVVLGEGFSAGSLEEGPASLAILHQARIELHYAVNHYFIAENAILEGADRLAGLPMHIIHGTRDFVCPVEAAYRLHRRLPEARLQVLPGAGHIAAGDDMIDALVQAADDMLAGADWKVAR